MIVFFKVKNFFSIKDEQLLSFEPATTGIKDEEYCIEVKEGVHLLKIAMLYGSNASGKTNVLLAMSFFRDLMTHMPEDKTTSLDFAPFLLDDESRKKHSEIVMCFYINQEKYILSTEFTKTKIYSEKLDYYGSNQPSNLYTRIYDEETDATSIKFGNKLMLKKKSQESLEGNTTNNCSVLAAFSKTNIEASQLNDVFTYFRESIGNMLRPNASLIRYAIKSLDENKSKNFILHLLQASDFNISDINVIKDEIAIDEDMKKAINAAPIPEKAKEKLIEEGRITNEELRFTHSTDNGVFHLPENMESRGTLRFLGIAFLLKELLLKNKILLVDEIESSLHYELLSFFIKVYLANSAKHSQLILTTHDITLLNEDYVRRDVIWFTDKDEFGCTHIVRLSSLGLHKTLSPYNAYKQGKLVELPFLGSIYLNLDDLCDEE